MFNFLKKKPGKLLVIGLDCVPPELVFDQWRAELPHLDQLMRRGVYGPLRSSTPCITVPAWSVMTSSKDPGVLGIYGFRNRADHTYKGLSIATGEAVKEPRVWEILGQAGKRVVTIGVPGTYPPRPVNGAQIGCFLTPRTVRVDAAGRQETQPFTFPAALSAQVNEWAGGEYVVDVKQFRTDNKDFLLQQIYDMTRQHFTVVRKMLKHQPWDFFMFVEMGTDRIHHGFWRYHDPTHAKFEPGSPYEHAIRDYYRYLDGEIGQVLHMLEADTTVMVVSDHGVKKMDGGICINEWLLRNGWLSLAQARPDSLTPIDKVMVDWPQTRAWGEGGYYARVFLNVAGREPDGVIPADQYEQTRDELAEQIRGIRGPNGNDIGTRVFKPQDIYRSVNRIAPDLIVYFGDLLWRSVGSLGHRDVWTMDNDTGPDDANHAENGILIYSNPRQDLGGQARAGLDLMDVAPTVLQHFGVPIPADMQGKALAL